MKEINIKLTINSDSERMGGLWCIKGTRWPISMLDEYLDGSTGFGGNGKFNKKRLKKDFPDIYSKLFIK